MSHNRQSRLRRSTYPRTVRSNELVFAFHPDNFGDGPMRCYVNSMSDRHHGLNRESLNALSDEVARMAAEMDAKEAAAPSPKGNDWSGCEFPPPSGWPFANNNKDTR